jgi:hypothetical protein
MIQNIIFGLLGDYFAREDANRALDPLVLGRGTLQRFVECVGKELDDYLIPKIANLIARTNGDAVLDTLVPIVERSRGLESPLYDDIDTRRWLLSYLNMCERHKGTLQNYIFLLGKLGFDVELTEDYRDGTWDDGTWDLAQWDSYANINGSFHLTLSVRYVLSVTPALISQIERIIEWNKPIHAQSVTYNIIGFEPVIELDTNTLDFGTVAVGNTPQLSFFITNTGNAPLTVSDITVPFATYALSWSGGIIAADGAQEVVVTFSPTNTSNQDGTITVVSNATSGGNTLSVTGVGFMEIGVKFNGITNYNIAPFDSSAVVPVEGQYTYSVMFRSSNIPNVPAIIGYVWHYQVSNLGMATYGSDFFVAKRSASSGGYDQIKITDAIQPNTLYHAVFVNTGVGTAGMKVYMNGVECALSVQTDIGATGTPTSGGLVMGSYEGVLFHFAGQIFHWRKYNVAMSPAQVLEEYESGYRLQSLEANLLSAYEVQETSADYGILRNGKIGSPNATLLGYSSGELANSRVDISGNIIP